MAIRLPAPERRRQLLDVARVVFAGRGFHSTSMNDVADAAGVTKPVLYQHFLSKRQLYVELLEDVGAQLLDAVAKATAAAASPRQQVEAGFEAYFRFVDTDREAFRLLFGGGSRRDDEFAEVVRRVEDTMAQAIAALIDVDLDADHRRRLGYGLVGLAEATGRQWVRDGDPAPPDTLARQVADLAWGGLRNVKRP